MKKLLKGFTLVEILIVIVIIGILIGALVPRMSAAQGRARDVARKNDLSNLQAAIIVAYQDHGNYPCVGNDGNLEGCNEIDGDAFCKAEDGCDIYNFKSKLEAAGMNTVPRDPLLSNVFYGVGENKQSTGGNYRYVTMKSHGVDNGGFGLMAKTEVAGGSNWVVCMNDDGTTIKEGALTGGMDVKTTKLCESLDYKKDTCHYDATNGNCTYSDETELRYVMMY